MSQEGPVLGILMLEGKMSLEAGCLGGPATFPYPVRRKVVEGSRTPFSAADARAMLPLYVRAARELEREGVGVITANCGLIALLQQELAASVRVPVVTSALLMVPLVSRMLAPGRTVGILTFYTDPVGEANFNACGWSSRDVPVAVRGVGGRASWEQFLCTKEIDGELRPRLEQDLCATVREMLAQHPDVGAFVSECTMLPTSLQVVRDTFGLPVYDVLTMLDWAVSGRWRPADAGRPAAAVAAVP